MSNGKCMASHDGICRSVYAFGVKCSGYSTSCKLRPAYNNLERVAEGLENRIRDMFGIVGDKR